MDELIRLPAMVTETVSATTVVQFARLQLEKNEAEP